jgi:uncharacterized protein YbcI
MPGVDLPAGGQLLSELSNAIVALHREHFGRGRGAAKAFLVDDVLVVILTDVFTTVERTLIKAGRSEQVRQTRLLHGLALEEEFKAPVQELTDRRVQAYVGTVSFDPDLAVALFLFDPRLSAESQPRSGSRRKNSTE